MTVRRWSREKLHGDIIFWIQIETYVRTLIAAAPLEALYQIIYVEFIKIQFKERNCRATQKQSSTCAVISSQIKTHQVCFR